LYGGGRDRWDGYPQERAELLQWIKDKKITNIAFISADLHYAAVVRLPGKLGKAITAGPIAAPMNVFSTGNASRFEYFSKETFNYGMITVDTASPRPDMLIEIFDEQNDRLYKTKLSDV
jgi:phosphodiesterase/alkaline phosphatase D-like protein